MSAGTGITKRGYLGAAIALIAVVALGYWGYSSYMKRELRAAVAVLLKDAGGQLGLAINIEAGPPVMDPLQAATKLDGHVAAIDKTIMQFKRLDLAWDRAFTDGADSYLMTARDVIAKQAASHRLFLLHRESLQLLRDQMRADNRTGPWVQTALRAKALAEKDFRNYRLAAAAYGTLLGSFPALQKRISGYVEPSVLIEEGLLAKARERALEASARAAAEMEKVRQLKIR